MATNKLQNQWTKIRKNPQEHWIKSGGSSNSQRLTLSGDRRINLQLYNHNLTNSSANWHTQKSIALVYVFQIRAIESRLNRTNLYLWNESRDNDQCGTDACCLYNTLSKLKYWTDRIRFSLFHNRAVSTKILRSKNKRQKIGVVRIFDWVGANHNSHVKMSSKIFERGYLYGTNIS